MQLAFHELSIGRASEQRTLFRCLTVPLPHDSIAPCPRPDTTTTSYFGLNQRVATPRSCRHWRGALLTGGLWMKHEKWPKTPSPAILPVCASTKIPSPSEVSRGGRQFVAGLQLGATKGCAVRRPDQSMGTDDEACAGTESSPEHAPGRISRLRRAQSPYQTQSEEHSRICEGQDTT